MSETIRFERDLTSIFNNKRVEFLVRNIKTYDKVTEYIYKKIILYYAVIGCG